MTSPAGSIGIGVSIDASDLASEITRAVTSQLRPVLSALQGDISRLTRGLGDIDSSGIDRAADGMDDLRENTDRATQSTDRAAQSAEELRSALNRVDASSMRDIVRGAENAQQELSQLDATQLNALIQEAQRAGQNIGQELGAGATQAQRELSRLDQAGLDQLIRNARQARDALNEVEQEAEETGAAGGRMGDQLKGAAGKVAGLAAGLVGIGGAMDLATSAIEQNSLGNKLQAQLALTTEEAARAGRLTGELYASNFGGSVEEVNAAVGAVQSTIGRLGEDSDEAFKAMTASALTMADVFEIDVAESTQTANTLIRNGLAKDGVEAMDLITAAMQRVPANLRGEIFPVMDEYSTYFQSIGFSGQEAMGIIVNASQQGQIAMDKAGDAIKEFGIRATDLGDKGAMDAITALGLNSQQMANDLLAGGDTAQRAFDQIIDGLLEIDDPAEQASAAIALFGTPLEDLDKAKIPGFLQGLSSGEDAMADFAGSAQQMTDTMGSGPGAAIETVKRSIEQGLIGALGKAAQWMVENKTTALILAGAIGTLGAAYVAYRTIAGVAAVVTGVNAALRGQAIATTAAAGAQRAFTATSVIMTAVQKGMAGASALASAAMRGLSAAFLSSPIGWIVLAIGAVVGALALFFTKTETGKRVWQQLMEWVQIAWEGIKTAIVGAWNNFIWPALQAIWNFITNTLVPIFIFLWQQVIVPAWNAIANVISQVWNNWIMPVFTAIHNFIVNVIAPALIWWWQNVTVPVFNAIATVISSVWNNFIKPVWDAFVWVLQNVLAPLFTWLWQNIISPVMQGIGATIGFVWNNVIKPIWDAFVWLLQNVLAPVFGWLWNTIIAPAMQGIGMVISGAWNNVIKPVIDFMLGGWHSIGEVLKFAWENVIRPVWNALGDAISWVWENVIRVAFDAIKTALTSVGDFFSDTVDGIGRVWDGLKNLLAKPVNFMIGTVYNDGIRKAWNVIAGFLPGIDEAGEVPLIPEHHDGGRINGPKGRDNVLMWGEAGEHMLTVQEVLKAGGHSLVYAMRDMISRGIPFKWENGRITAMSGNGSLAPRDVASYGDAVASRGLGKVLPEGLFNRILPSAMLPAHRRGGEIAEEPWMRQLLKGHQFAKSQSGKPYQWAGPTGPDSSFDCSGFMGSIAAAILGLNPWQRYMSTATFGAGQRQSVNASGINWVAGVDGGFSIGVLDDPGGPGGGHTAGTLGALAALGIPGAVNVESGGAAGGVGYGQGPGPFGFPTQYHLPIGANGFFQPGRGSAGPSPEEQRGFLERKVISIMDEMLDPVRSAVDATVPPPPPSFYQIPRTYLDKGPEMAVDIFKNTIKNIGGGLSSAWTKAQDITEGVLDRLNPFDSGGIARGKGLMPKNVIAPERVLDPRQTQLFEVLVTALTRIAGFSVSDFTRRGGADDELLTAEAMNDATGRMASDTAALLDRTESSREAVATAQHQQTMELQQQILGQLAEKVLAPMVQTGISGAMQAATKDGTLNALGTSIGQIAGQIVAASVSASSAASGAGAALYDSGGLWPSGTMGVNLSGSHERVLDPAQTRAFDAGLLGGWNLQPMQQHMARNANDTVGADFFGVSGGMGGGILNTLVRVLLEVIGVQIEVRNTLTDMTAEIRQFRGDLSTFDATGRLTSDTSGLLSRSESSEDLVVAERLRILKQVIMGLVKFVIDKVIVPMLNSLFQGLIQMATTGIGTAIGGALGGPLGAAAGTAIGNLAGQVVGAGLGGLASVATSLLGGILTAGIGGLLDGAFGLFDDGGIANGVGLMPKAVIAPERVLSPSNTKSFDRFVDLLARGDVPLGGGRTTTIHAPFTVTGGEGGGKAARDRLLELMS
ncbi:tail length tape measure protein [Gordonia phage Sour]|uniref:Tape measure protein n=1 Tax=Gordonia phage Sour TaxID=2182349 RepID=A0A2U8UKJ6_9CAUD|nr:tail length tape measure protein [Gordonia phage Sour]AWN04229.1 tape measure protein [Gordonia phage Sour]